MSGESKSSSYCISAIFVKLGKNVEVVVLSKGKNSLYNQINKTAVCGNDKVKEKI